LDGFESTKLILRFGFKQGAMTCCE